MSSCWALVSLCRQILYLCFCRAQCLVARALINTSVHSVIGAMRVCTHCEPMKPYTVGATRTGARFAVKASPRRQSCVVTWRSIPESLSSNVTFAAVSIVINVITRNTWNNIQRNHWNINSWNEQHLPVRIYSPGICLHGAWQSCVLNFQFKCLLLYSEYAVH